MFSSKSGLKDRSCPPLSAFGAPQKRPVLFTTFCIPAPSVCPLRLCKGFSWKMGDYQNQNGATYYTSGAQQVYAGSPPVASYAYAPAGQQVVTRTVPAGYATTGHAPGYSAAPMPSVSYVQQAAPQVVQTRAVAAPAQQIVQTRAVGAVAGGPPVAPDDLPAGAS
jgi:hypothetical protein